MACAGPPTTDHTAWGSYFVSRGYVHLADHCDDGERAAFGFLSEEIGTARVLDLRVGAGRTTSLVAERSASYVGIDSSQRMIDLARARHPQVDLRVSDARALTELADDSFDIVIFRYNGIDCVPAADRRLVLDEVFRACARAAGSCSRRSTWTAGSSVSPQRCRPARPGHTASVRSCASVPAGHGCPWPTGTSPMPRPPRRAATAGRPGRCVRTPSVSSSTSPRWDITSVSCAAPACTSTPRGAQRVRRWTSSRSTARAATSTLSAASRSRNRLNRTGTAGQGVACGSRP